MLTADTIDAIAEVWIEQEDDGSLSSQRDQDLADLCASHKEALDELSEAQALVAVLMQPHVKDAKLIIDATKRADEASIALKNLVEKLDAIEPHISNVCAIAQIHGVPYTGPNWADEIAAARAVLAQKG